ncbi:MAG TPA: PQQ-dependent sugar dehydrogenase [Actinophytocola sp.]|uniref:PQQ-dependent sugar dehydrogenase n=1 Tax=Actinophytocola sp. TaxID=1872138 RepID=UPI002DDCA49F|nr:PQQ-dependent sugar dehydrogenase [Actinophytocola sp.]HEV2780332.1 PQQ-dependent sugar dehydrogenase [Actinophytocola sp.]
MLLRSSRVVAVVAAAVLAASLAVTLRASQAHAAPMLPSGFLLQDIPTGMRPAGPGGDQLTDFAFLPDESFLAIAKQGKVTWAPGLGQAGEPRQIAALPVQGAADLGLVGLAVAPDYPTSRAIYTARSVLTTESPSGSWGQLRLSRWTVTTDTAGIPTGLTGEQAVLKLTGDMDAHAMTGVIAAEDGTIWLSIGDNADHRRVDTLALRALNLDDPHGKLLHLRPDGSGVPTNPFYDPADPRATRSLVYASGLRSPFRVSLEPGTGRPLLGDVGWNTFEEIDVVAPGNNYGWPCWEGNEPTGGYRDLPQCAATTTALPAHAYPRTTGSSVTGGLVYTGTSYPEQYRGRYFFGDYGSRRLWTIGINQLGRLSTQPETDGFGNDIGLPVAFRAMPTGGDIAYADILSGKVRRLVYAPGNAAPNPVIRTTVDAATRTVTFDAGESFDPNGDPITFGWAFGDGTTGTGARVTHAYPAGTDSVTVTLTATDSLDASATATATVHPGNHAPALSVWEPDPGKTFAAGEVITATATATDPEDGPLTVTWSVTTVHCRSVGGCHDHPGAQQQGGNFQLTFDGHAGDTRLEISASATDSRGTTSVHTFGVRPKQRRITVQSNQPAGFTIGGEQTDTGLFTVGMTLPIIAPDAAVDGVATFDRWGDGGTERVRELTLPDADQTLTVSYLTPIDRRYAGDAALQSTLGSPVGVEQGDASVRWREYQRGRAYWSPAGGVHAVAGDILTVYLSRGGHLAYGPPLTGETAGADGTGRFIRFQRGTFYWKPGLGTFSVEGDIQAKYETLGAERSVLGYPTTHQSATPDGLGRFNHFQGGGSFVYTSAAPFGHPEAARRGAPSPAPSGDLAGASIYWHPSTGAFAVYGPIRQRWAGLGWERSYLGYPTSDVLTVPDGRRMNFQYGYILEDFTTGQVRDARN